MEVKKEEHIKSVMFVVVVVIVVVNKLTMKMMDWLPKSFCLPLSNHSVFRDLAIGSYNSCGNYIDARSNTRSI